MKLSKKLIVTGLLFSSVLGSVNVGSISAMAANSEDNSQAAQVDKIKELKAIYMLDGKILDANSLKLASNIKLNVTKRELSKKDTENLLKAGYVLDSKKDNLVVSGNSVIVNLKADPSLQGEVKELKAIYMVNGEVLDANKLKLSPKIKLNIKNRQLAKEDNEKISRAGYVLDNKKENLIISNDSILINLTLDSLVQGEMKELKAIYMLDGHEIDANNEKLPKMVKLNIFRRELAREDNESILNSGYLVDKSNKSNLVMSGNSVIVYLKRLNTKVANKEVTFVFKDGENELKKLESTNTVKIVNLNDETYVLPMDIPDVNSKGFIIVEGQDYKVSGINGKNIVNIQVKKLVTTTINYRTPDGKKISVSNVTPEGDLIKLEAPKGYIVADNNGFIASAGVNSITVFVNPENPAKPAPKPAAKVVTQVTFMERASNKPVFSQTLQGKNGQEFAIKAPNGYKLEKNSITTYKLDKSVSGIIVYVTENTTIGDTSKYNTAVTTSSNATLYDNKGKTIKTRSLGAKTSWLVDQKMVADGVTYYRVATNEWVKATDVEEYAIVNSVIETKSDDAKILYTAEGKAIKNRALANDTTWFSDRSATINGEKMYRVATNEWVKASDIK